MGSTFQIGNQHIRNGIVCHDRAIAVKDGGLTILALSDGMGHPEFRCPDLGAQFAVSFIRENAVEIHGLLGGLSKGDDGKAVWNQNDSEKQFVEKLVRILQRMQDEATDYARRIGVGIGDMHCTLSFAIIGPEKMIQVAIGDSPLYIKSKGTLHMLDGQPANNRYVLSAYNMEQSQRGMAVSVGLTETLQAVLLVSDGCLGFQKDEESNMTAKDFPSWFYDLTQGRVSIQEAVQKLVDDGYDDCSFSYYVHET